MNKNTLKLSLGALVLAGLASCGGGSSSDDVQFIPVQTTEGGAWHFINPKGELVGNQEWEFEPTVTTAGIFTVQSHNGYDVYKWDGDEAKPIDSLQNLVSVGVYNEGLLPVTPSMQRIRVVNKKGDVKFILEPIDGQEISSCSGIVQDGMLVFTTMEGKSGAMNSKGEVIIKPKYDEISDFKDGFALAAEYSEDYEQGPTYFVLDKEGNSIKVNGKFEYPEGDCASIESFENGVVTVWGRSDSGSDSEEGDYGDYVSYEINTKGEVSVKKDESSWTQTLDNGDKITYSYKDDHSTNVWTNTKGEVVMQTSENGVSLTGYGKYVTLSSEDSMTIYSDDGKELNKLSGNYYAYSPGGKFGLVLEQWSSDYQSKTTLLLDAEGKPIDTMKFYGVGVGKSVNDLGGEEEEYGCGYYTVTSAYVDVTAAASKLVSMITTEVKGKDSYYIGESVKTILEGQSIQYMSGKTFSIPTADGVYYLATGAGFNITGEITASTNIVAPTYKEYFEVHHYDYWGTAWGWRRKKQVGVHVNPSAKVVSFDIILRTNHPSGQSLREAVGRRLKKDGYTLVDSGENFEEYSNNWREAIIYGADNSNGIGVIIGEKNNLKMSNSEKSALAAKI